MFCRFFKAYDTQNVHVLELKQVLFVSVNSMGLDDDGCFMCKDVEIKLKEISKYINCSQQVSTKFITRIAAFSLASTNSCTKHAFYLCCAGLAE